MSLTESICKKASKQLFLIWEEAKVPKNTLSCDGAAEHIRRFHTEWQNLKKHTNQQMLVDNMKDLFNAAHVMLCTW